MRSIRIIRPRCMEAAMNALFVEIDGQRMEKLANGKEATVSIDEGKHSIAVRGGKLASKQFFDELVIPSGNQSYAFFINMMSLGDNGYKPVLRPCKGEALKSSPVRPVLTIGREASAIVLDEKLRGMMKELSGSYLTLNLLEGGWSMEICFGPERKQIMARPYLKIKGKLMAAAMNLIEQGGFQTPESRAETTETLMSEYLALLPGYERVGENGIRFVG